MTSELAITPLQNFVLIEAVAVGSGFVRGFAGFGGPAIMILILTHFYTPLSVTIPVMLVDFTANIPLLRASLANVSWRTTGVLTAASLLFVPMGLIVLINVDPLIVKRLIAFVVGTSALALLFGWRMRNQASFPALLAAGAFSGALLGATYIALPAMIFLLAQPDPASTSRSNAIVWIFVMSTTFIFIMAFNGQITTPHIQKSVVLGAGYCLGVVLGARLFHNVHENVFRRLVLVLLLSLSIIGFIR
jgi:uncharacterized membrane protein YfcA